MVFFGFLRLRRHSFIFICLHFETSVARKFRAENTKGEPQNTKKNTTLKTKKHHVFGYKNTKYLIKSFKNGPPKHFYCIFVHQFLKNFNFLRKFFKKFQFFLIFKDLYPKT